MKAIGILLAGTLVLAWAAAAVAGEAVVDPTRPPAALRPQRDASAPAAAPTLELNGVLTSPERTVAVINGQPVQVGEWIGDARVEAIRPEAVVLRQRGETRVIPLVRRPLKTTTGATR